MQKRGVANHAVVCKEHRHNLVRLLLCPLEGVTLGEPGCFFKSEEASINGLLHLGKQDLIFVAGTSWVNATKGMLVRMDDLVLDQDDKGVLFLLT